ncbi:MAG: phosphate signaling complex protein PhoU [Planctomycetota bacterium]|nr:phosphate signaling complex protein PhoU [Planctomycetota bacterium]
MSIDLQADLTTLRRSVLEMCGIIEVRFDQALHGLFRNQRDDSLEVRHGDADVNEMEIEIEAQCLNILALGQPVAGDLRFVLSVMRINSSLERIGDLTKSIAKRSLSLFKHPMPLPDGLPTMADTTRTMLLSCVESFANEDVESARRVRQSDQIVDDLQKEVITWAQEAIAEQVDTTTAAIDIMSIARKLERIADLATNIAEDVIFMIEGSMVRHTSSKS